MVCAEAAGPVQEGCPNAAPTRFYQGTAAPTAQRAGQ